MSLYSTNLDHLYRFIVGKIILSRNWYRFIGDKNFCQKNCIALTDFFSKIVYLYRFKRYIFEYRCPSLPRTLWYDEQSSSRECHCQAAGFLPQIYFKKIQIFKKERVLSFFA
jgi:hypothetical protein